jgi:hypothetical protein
MRKAAVLVLWLSFVSMVCAQQRTYVVAVAVDSRDVRIQQWAPELRRGAADVVERAAGKAKVVIVTGTPAEAAEQARANAADYLLRIEISPKSNVSVGLGAPPGSDPELVGATRANAHGQIFLAWTVEPINGKKLRLHDSRYVHATEYPLGPQFDWLHAISSRSVRDAAAAAISKLKSKKGFEP